MEETDIKAYINAVGPEMLQRYIEQFPPNILALGFYRADNASTWLNIPKFMAFVASEFQANEPMSSPATPRRSTLPKISTPARSELSQASDVMVAVEAGGTPSGTKQGNGLKRRRDQAIESESEVEIVDEQPIDIYMKSPVKSNCKKRQTLKRESDVEEVKSQTRITRQLVVDELRILKSIPQTWEIGAWLLDLRDDDREWTDAAGDNLSMASIIKSQDQDSWGGGSGGSIDPKKCPAVIPLGNQRCQLSEHVCQGIYHCSELDMSLIDSCERYGPDATEMKKLFDAEREINLLETSTVHQAAAAFYKEALKEPCKARINLGGEPEQPCPGEPVFRLYKDKSFDGKSGFVGCSGWIRGKNSRAHRFIPVPRNVNESLVQELFDSKDGHFKDSMITTKACARIVSVRSGGKGRQECPYTHLKNGQVVQGFLIHRSCDTKIRIYSPLDRIDRRAIVIIQNAHNHPRFPSTKVSRKGRDLYSQAVRMNGISRATALKIDMAPATKTIFGGKSVAEIDPALAIARNKRDLIKKLKADKNPHGLGLEGVLFQKREDDLKLPERKRYIHEILTQDGIEMVITMIPGLAIRIHDAEYTLHDNTYKRVSGDWKEWEVVIWDGKLNIRLTVARIYCNRETRRAFTHMWSGFWDTVERITGRSIQFRFMDGKGLSTILVDGCKPQVDACGDSLILQVAKRKGNSLVYENDPQVIVQYVVRTCDIHLERKLDDLAKTLPPDVMKRVRGFPFLQTVAEVEDFKKFCEESTYKNLRDWIIDKKSAPWFMASVNRFMSKIPEDIWYTTPGHTNLNESAHPFTNMHTGINQPLVEAIRGARELDLAMEAKVLQMEESCVLINPHNTKVERDRLNRKRNEARARSAASREDALNQITEIEDELNNVSQTQKNANSRKRELRDLKKTIQAENGLKRSPHKTPSARGKTRIPLDNEIDEPNVLDTGISDTGHTDHSYDAFWKSFSPSYPEHQPSASKPEVSDTSNSETSHLPYPQVDWEKHSFRDIELMFGQK